MARDREDRGGTKTRDREDREERRVKKDSGRRLGDFGRWSSEQDTGSGLAVKLPEGVSGFWRPRKPGPQKIEIIPYEVSKRAKAFLPKTGEVGDLFPVRPYWCHKGIGPNNDTVTCIAKTFGKPCPICEARSELARSSDKDDEERVKALAPKHRQLWLIYDHNDPGKGLQLWDESWHNFGKHLVKKIDNADEEDRPRLRRFFDPDDGLTIKLIGSEESSGSGYKYMEFTVDEFRTRKEDLDKDIVDHGVSLDDAVNEMEYKELKRLYLQISDEDDDGGKKGGKSGGKKDEPVGGKKGRRDEPDDDDDDDDEDDPPARGKKGGGKGRDADIGDDDDDDPAGKWKVGQKVTFTYKDKELTGKIVKVNERTELVQVKTKDRDEPYNVDMEDLDEPAGDDDPPARGKKGGSKDDDADDADDAPRGKKGGRKEADDDDDDEDDPPARGKKGDKEKEPAGKKGGKSGGKGKEEEDEDDDWGDDDDDDEDDPPARGKKGGKK